jgi:hypothetical protein
MKTNIRVPLVWAETFREGVVVGTNDWDATVKTAYTVDRNAAYQNIRGFDRIDIVLDLMINCALEPDSPCDGLLSHTVMERIWPDLDFSVPDYEWSGPTLFEAQGIKLRDFLGFKK